MLKIDLVYNVSVQLQRQLDTLLHASHQAHQSATHCESKAENKYDTLGLEAAYLAHGLSVRAQQLQRAISAFHQWVPRSFGADDGVGVGALVVLNDEQGVEKRFFVATQGGGIRVATEAGDVTVVTPAAPLGKALLGKQLDDEVVLQVDAVRKLYCVVGLT
ncbi:MAG: transcription elongation factor GreAB [Motiliproteus sp.]